MFRSLQIVILRHNVLHLAEEGFTSFSNSQDKLAPCCPPWASLQSLSLLKTPSVYCNFQSFGRFQYINCGIAIVHQNIAMKPVLSVGPVITLLTRSLGAAANMADSDGGKQRDASILTIGGPRMQHDAVQCSAVQ
jgi:hypothetical protein